MTAFAWGERERESAIVEKMNQLVLLIIILLAILSLVRVVKPSPGSGNQSTLEKTVSAMFGNPDQGGRCRWLRGSRKQNRMCRRDAGVPETLQAARTLATTHCSEQFRYDRWNCSASLGNTHFLHKGRVYRETAFLHAISAAAIAYSVSRACADGKLTRCKCAEEKDPQETRRTWRWGGCGDNVKFGRRFTRNFLQLRSVGQDTTAAILRYNSEVGIQVAASKMENVCKCHGVSGSCTTKTCWRRLAPFQTTAAILKSRYHQALRRDPDNASSRRPNGRLRLSPDDPLLYLERSPTFCALTGGRRCQNADNCATLCCGRGYNLVLVPATRPCNCRWETCCFVQCDRCFFQQEVYTCK
uniref:Protein Wnt n=1 Tax=Timema douglasi TaxID=61478 RepID=A0A7R8Z7T4_TIMDO|nr:unnamed protein product [Timema douglasi]